MENFVLFKKSKIHEIPEKIPIFFKNVLKPFLLQV